MQIDLIRQESGTVIAQIVADNIIINTLQDALDLMANCDYRGARKIIIHEKNLIADFFDLQTRLAGAILQKFSNYRMSLAIIGDFGKYRKQSFQAFIYESNRTGRICFVENLDEALKRFE